MAVSVAKDHFPVVVFVLIATTTLFFLANAQSSGYIEKPKFIYVERLKVKISYENKPNLMLYICCDVDFDAWFKDIYCQPMSSCPVFKALTTCKLMRTQVICTVNRVLPNVTIKGYVASGDRKLNVSSNEVATFVTEESKKLPQAVSEVAVNATVEGLTVQWKPLTRSDYSAGVKYTHLVYCQPLENRRAKAVRGNVEFQKSHFPITHKNITAVSKYSCCVKVVNVRTSAESQPTCQNVTTTEQAPASPPIITCGNDTACLAVIRGMHRNITILFQPPAREDWNGELVRHEIFYKNSTAVETTQLTVHNGSATEAVIPDLQTGTIYDIFMKSCTKIGCSLISNTVRIPPVSYHDKNEQAILKYVPYVALACFVILGIMAFFMERYRRLQREKQLPKLEEPVISNYDYPPNLEQDDTYLQLENVSTRDNLKAVVVLNPVTLAAVNV